MLDRIRSSPWLTAPSFRCTRTGSRRRQTGVTAIEYALIAALIAIAIIGGLSVTGNGLKNLYDASTSKIIAAIQNAVGP